MLEAPKQEKRCSRCGEIKPLTEFPLAKKHKDGREYSCKSCTKPERALQARKRYWSRPEYERKRRSNFRMIHREPSEQDRNPRKAAARKILRDEVRLGRISKPDNCQECGAGGIIHGHHEDYDAPLSVDWLCPKCHAKRHRKYDDALAGSAE